MEFVALVERDLSTRSLLDKRLGDALVLHERLPVNVEYVYNRYQWQYSTQELDRLLPFILFHEIQFGKAEQRVTDADERIRDKEHEELDVDGAYSFAHFYTLEVAKLASYEDQYREV